jgi:hypothetical protein
MPHHGSVMTVEKPEDADVSRGETSSENAAVVSPVERRNQYGRTWKEHRQYLMEHLRHSMTEDQLAREIAIQERQFEIFSGFVATVDGRQAQLQRSFDATPPERHARLLEAARRSWK